MKLLIAGLFASTSIASAQVQFAFTNFAGLPGTPGSTNGSGSAARFQGPYGVALDAGGNLYVADSDNHMIRKVSPAGVVTTAAGSTNSGTTDATGTAAQFFHPRGVAVDSATNVYIADSYNHTIRKMTPATVVTTLAGSPSQPGSSDGTATARFNFPLGVAVDSATNVYVADQGNHTIRMITPAGVVSTLAGSAGQSGSADGFGGIARFNLPYGVAVDNAGNVYVADTWNNLIRKIISGGYVMTLAGSGQSGSSDGSGTSAQFFQPNNLALDSAGNLYVTDTWNFTIRKVTPGGIVTTLAGSAGQAGSANGIGSAARFNYPSGIAMDSAGRIYIGDTLNYRIAKGSPLFQFQTTTLFGGSLRALLTGPFGSNAVIEASTDLQSWSPVQTNSLSPDGLSLSLPIGTNPRSFFRARLAP